MNQTSSTNFDEGQLLIPLHSTFTHAVDHCYGDQQK